MEDNYTILQILSSGSLTTEAIIDDLYLGLSLSIKSIITWDKAVPEYNYNLDLTEWERYLYYYSGDDVDYKWDEVSRVLNEHDLDIIASEYDPSERFLIRYND